MDNSPNLNLPYIAPSQAQKHVTHNEAIRRLDTLVQLAVLTSDLAEPPDSAAPGDCHIVPAEAYGEWEGLEGTVAAWQDGGWEFYTPRIGWVAWLEEKQELVVWNGTEWIAAQQISEIAELKTGNLGINTLPDSYNRLFVKSESVLFSHDDVTPGSGSIRHSLNKKASGDTCSLLFQSGYSARAEIGLAGNDSLHVKVSPDGNTYIDAIVVDKNSGKIGIGTSTPQADLHVEGVLRLGSHSITSLPVAAEIGAGGIAYVTDSGSGPVLAYSDGSQWRRADDNLPLT